VFGVVVVVVVVLLLQIRKDEKQMFGGDTKNVLNSRKKK
jgi:preprotein translocase subunit SecG